MSGLRDRKKAENRRKMLEAAKSLFVENGYSRTNMDEIAERAGFGVATLYNYFRTKEGMFATMAREDMALLQQRGEEVLALGRTDAVGTIYELLLIYSQVFNFVSYSVVQEFQVQARSSGPLHEVSAWVLRWQKDQVMRVLRFCQSQGTVSERLDCDLAAEIVIDQHVRFVQRPKRDAAGLEDKDYLKSVLAFMLEGWTET